MVFPVLEGKVAIITGSAMGMGEATAKLFAEAKAKVVVADFNKEKGKAVVELIKATGGEAAFVKVDVSKSEEVQKMVKFTVDTYGKLDVAVNNAVLTPDDESADSFDEDDWDFGQPDEIAQATLWLASNASSYVTGAVIHAEAGYTSR